MKNFYLFLTALLIVLAILIVGFGLMSSLSAPQESSVIGMGCLLSILARIAQASAHNIK